MIEQLLSQPGFTMRLMGSIIFLANGSARNAQRLMHAIV